MIELLPETLVILGDCPSKANLSLDWKLKNVPSFKIKNPGLRGKKKRYEEICQYQDYLRLTCQSFKNKHRIPDVPAGNMVFISMIIFFEYKKISQKKHSGLGPQDFSRDMDNAEKLIYDTLATAGLYSDDKVIVQKVVTKQVTATKPRLEIVSLCHTASFSDFIKWQPHQFKKTLDRSLVKLDALTGNGFLVPIRAGD